MTLKFLPIFALLSVASMYQQSRTMNTSDLNKQLKRAVAAAQAREVERLIEANADVHSLPSQLIALVQTWGKKAQERRPSLTSSGATNYIDTLKILTQNGVELVGTQVPGARVLTQKDLEDRIQ